MGEFILPFVFLCVFAVNLVTHGVDAYAEMIAGDAVAFEISRDGLQDKMEKLAAKPGVDPESKAREMNWYLLTDENIAAQQWFAFLYRSYQEILSTAADQLKTNAQPTISKENVVLFNPKKDYSSEELELLIVNSKGKLRTVNNKLSKLETELNKFSLRPQQIREETLNSKQRLKQAKLEINISRQPTENKYEYQAHQIYLNTLISALSEELKKLDLEATVNPSQIQLNNRSQEQLAVKQKYLQHIVDQQEALFWKVQLEKAASLEEALLKTEQESISKHAVIQKIIQDNIYWSRDLQTIVRTINQYDHEIDKIDTYKRSIEEDYKNVEKKIKLAGLNPLLGRVLREQRNTLETNKQQYQRQVDIGDETGLISLALYKIELRQKQLRNFQTELDLQLQQVQKSHGAENLSVGEIQKISQEIDKLLSDQKEVLAELSNTYLKDLRVLGDYKFASEQLLTLIDQYTSFLDQRLLWVPSSLPIDLDYPVDVYNSMRWLGSPMRWLHFGENLLQIVKGNIIISSFAFIFWFSLLYLNFYLSKKVCAIREKIGKPYTDKIYYTFQVLLFNFILVLPLPLLLFFISWQLSLLPFHNDFSRAIGVGMQHAAIVLMILLFFIRFLEDQGIAELHFRWQKKAICLIRKQLAWMKFVIVPCIFIIYMTSANNMAEHSNNLGRLGLITFASVLFIFAIRLFQPGQGILDGYFIKNTNIGGLIYVISG